MDSFDDTGLALMKFGVGQPVSRKEDPTQTKGFSTIDVVYTYLYTLAMVA